MALITACFGGYDPVRSLPENHGFDDAVCVTDNPDGVGEGWRVHVEPVSVNPRLTAKRPKMMPWLYTDCDAAVWLDASFQVQAGFHAWAIPHLERDDFVVWIHPEGRVDITDEARVSMGLKKYHGSHVLEQARSYKEQGFPHNWGLFAGGTVGWRFTPQTQRFGALWHRECEDWSIQDQVSLPYVLWSEGMKFGIWQANEYENPYLTLKWDERPNPQK